MNADEAPVAAVALVADLMFASRVRDAARATGVGTITVSRTEKLLDEVRKHRPGVVLIDLQTRGQDTPGAIARLKTEPTTADIPVVAFGPHVDAEALRAARDAGADRVLARSAFVRELPAILRGASDRR